MTGRPDDSERTQAMRLPPVPGRSEPVAADQPTDQLPAPERRAPTTQFGPWQPLQPRVVPRRRSRTPYVVAALVLLVLAVGVVAVLVWG